ncbi:MAG: hypothetical protein DRG31_07510 [Deltaproteobacteria bacterium]|nr:MAG: hypothetical protein DRG31_07510 [Deltaproteobacteria bacterium]
MRNALFKKGAGLAVAALVAFTVGCCPSLKKEREAAEAAMKAAQEAASRAEAAAQRAEGAAQKAEAAAEKATRAFEKSLRKGK